MMTRKPGPAKGRPCSVRNDSERRLTAARETIRDEHIQAAKDGDEPRERALFDARAAINQAIAILRGRGR